MQISKSGQILDLSNDSKREEKIPCLIVVELNSCFQKKKKKKKKEKANKHTPPISLDLCFGGLTGPFFLNFGFGKIMFFGFKCPLFFCDSWRNPAIRHLLSWGSFLLVFVYTFTSLSSYIFYDALQWLFSFGVN